MNRRLLAVIKKEFIQLLRDKRMIGMIIVAPILQLVVFGYVATTDINSIPSVVFDRDNTSESRAFVSRFENSGYFRVVSRAASFDGVLDALDPGTAKVGISIPDGFASKLLSGEQADVQFMIDGSDSNYAAVASSYMNGVAFGYSMDRLKSRYPGIENKLSIIDARTRIWHNQKLKSVNYMVPAVLALLLMVITSVLTSAAIVKEKEYGTLEQIVVSPIRPYELMLGKTVPLVVLGFVDILLVLFVADIWFGVKVAGSIPLLLVLCTVFLLTSLGTGLLVSTVSQTIQQTILTVIFIMLPSILLSGFIFPIANMPDIIQPLTYLIPLRYFLTIVRSIFLKGIGLEYLWPESVVLTLFGVAIFFMAVGRFRKKLG